MRIQDLPVEIHGKIIEYMDDFKQLHRRMMAPTLLILNRQSYPCRICRRNTMQDELCRICLTHLCKQIDPHTPYKCIEYGKLLYMPLPVEADLGHILDHMKFLFALFHMDFHCHPASIPLMPGSLTLHHCILIFAPFRRTSLAHLFFKKPADFLWTMDPPKQTEEYETLRSLNALFPK
jgi:hypothetical protein